MNKYIEINLVEAEITLDHADELEGYQIIHPSGNEDWLSKDVFEKSYMKIVPNPRLKTDVSISQNMVDDFIKEVHVSTIGDKTTLVRVVLVNGFEIIESSACVDKDNYSKEIGGEICLNKIKDKIWMLLGFLLQTDVGGTK